MFEREIDGGMQFLDNYYGNKGWVFQIDLGELELKSGCNCILGQLNGDYDTMMDLLDIEESDAIQLGFCLDYHDEHIDASKHDYWAKLTEEWRVALKDRVDLGVEL